MSANAGLVAGGLAALLVVLLVATGLAWRRSSRLERRLAGITRGEDGQSLERVLAAHLMRVAEVEADLADAAKRLSGLEGDARHAFQRIGFVRFNPFEDTGGNQSFALALLDADGDGVVVSSLHARGLTRIYAKALGAGRPEATLSAEEAEAVTLALGASLGRAAIADRVAAGGRSGRDRAAERDRATERAGA